MEPVVWQRLVDWWRYIVTAIVAIWFLVASIAGPHPATRLASSAQTETATSTTASPALVSSTIAPLSIVPNTRPDGSTTTSTSTPSGVGATIARSAPEGSGRTTRTTSPYQANGNVGSIGGSGIGGNLGGIGSNTALPVGVGGVDIAFKSIEAHPEFGNATRWEVNATVEVRNTTNKNIEFDPARLSLQLGSGALRAPEKPIRVQISPQVPVLVPLKYTVSTSSIRNYTLTYQGVVVQRGTVTTLN